MLQFEVEREYSRGDVKELAGGPEGLSWWAVAYRSFRT